MSHTPDTYTIRFSGYSMYPALRPGDCLVVRRVSSDRVVPGDILVRRNGDRHPVVHRLVRRLPRQRGITKGDALIYTDPKPVRLNRSVERVEAIIRGEKLIVFSTTLAHWQNRLRAVASRCGLSLAALKQQIKHAVVHGPGRPQDYQKGRMVRMLSQNDTLPAHRHHWPDLLKALESEGMTGLAHRRFTDRCLPAVAAKALADGYHNNLAMHLACGNFIEQLEAALRGPKVRVLTLKGVSLMHRYDGHPGDRPMQDVDIWVSPEDRTRLEHVLESLGFKQNRWRTGTFKGALLTVDLHTHPLHTARINSRTRLLAADTASIWQHSMPWRDEFRWVRRPTDIDNILLLSLHLLKHYYSRLIWLEDLRRLLLHRNQDFMAALLNRSAELGCTRSLLYSLYVLETLYPACMPGMDPVLDLKRLLSMPEKGLLLLGIADQPVSMTAPALQLLAIRGMRARLDFALETFFPKSRVIRSEFGVINPAQQALFIPLRIFKTLGLLTQPLRLVFRFLYRLRQIKRHA